MIRFFLLSMVFTGVFACNKEKEQLPIDNTLLIGRWRWNSTTYYKVEANALIKSSVQPGDSNSFVQFASNSALTLRLWGTPEQGTYSFTPANHLLQTIRANGYKEIDTVKTLTASELILHVKVIDTPLYNPVVIRTFLRIDSLSK